jgi:deazaflavin-dependent oxidoreductase (nitroreductase family)
MNAQRFYNPIVIGLLRSPLHLLGDQHTIILTVTGRKSGKRYTFPVSYLRDGDTLVVMTHRERTWWKNLQGGSTPVVVYVDGHDLPARAEIATDLDQVAKALLKFLQQVPAWRRELRVTLNPDGQPQHPEDLYQLARQGLIVCKIQLESARSPATSARHA